MNELVRAIRHFIQRDAALLLGGALVVVACLYRFELLSVLASGFLVSAFLVGLSYVLGFTIQALADIIHWTSTTPLEVPNGVDKRLYRRLTGKPWQVKPRGDYRDLWLSLTPIQRRFCERIIMLKMIGTAVGPSAQVAGLVVFSRYLRSHTPLDLWLTVSAILVGTFLIFIGRVKSMQQVEFYEGVRGAA